MYRFVKIIFQMILKDKNSMYLRSKLFNPFWRYNLRTKSDFLEFNQLFHVKYLIVIKCVIIIPLQCSLIC